MPRERSTLANRIRTRRRELGMTQNELAGNFFTRGFVSQVENGIIDPSLKTLEVIAHQLGLPVSSLLDEPDQYNVVDAESWVQEALQVVYNNKDLDHASDLAQRALDIAIRAHNNPVAARAFSALAWVAVYRKHYKEAADLFRKAAHLYGMVLNHIYEIKCLNAAANSAKNGGDYELAATCCVEAIDLFKVLNEPASMEKIRVLVNYGLILVEQKYWDKAVEALNKALDLSICKNEYYRLGHVYIMLGVSNRHLGNYREASNYLHSAKCFCQIVNDQLNAANASVNLGIVKGEMGELDEAQTLIEGAITTYSQLEQPAYMANAQAELAKIAWKKDELESALTLCESAIPNLENTKERGRTMILQAKLLLLLQRDLKRAAELIATGRDLVGSDATDEETAEAYYDYGNILLRLGHAEEAGAYLSKAADAFRKLKK